MSKRVKIIALFVFICPSVFCQYDALQMYMQRFSGADLQKKADVLVSASYNNSGEVLVKLYDYALQFALRNSEALKHNSDMINIVRAAINGLEDIGYCENIYTLWELFLCYSDTKAGEEILVLLGKFGGGFKYLAADINNFLARQIDAFVSGAIVDYSLISACITAILDLGDSSSYPVLFNLLCAGFPEVIAFEAAGAMDLIPGNYAQFLADVIRINPPEEKLAAFKAGNSSNHLSIYERGYLAELALEQSFSLMDGEENTVLSAMRYAAISALVPLRWTRASVLAIRHYYLVYADYQQGDAAKEQLVEAIACLGAVGDSDAALVLALQLGLINISTEKTGIYDNAITLAIIKALGMIGHKDVYEHLLQVSYLSYPDSIHSAAREAIEHLKW